MRIAVDFERCQSNSVCMAVAPGLFEVRDDGYLYVLDETPGEDRRASVEEAVASCPTQAISLVEE